MDAYVIHLRCVFSRTLLEFRKTRDVAFSGPFFPAVVVWRVICLHLAYLKPPFMQISTKLGRKHFWVKVVQNL